MKKIASISIVTMLAIPSLAGQWDYYPHLDSAICKQGKEINLFWKKAPNQGGLIVERKKSGEANYSIDTTLSSNTDSFATIIAPEFSTSYSYRIKLLTNGQQVDTSWRSDPVEVTTQVALKAPKLQLGWNESKESMELSIVDSSTTEDGYSVTALDKNGSVTFNNKYIFSPNETIKSISFEALPPNEWFTLKVNVFKGSDTIASSLSLYNIQPKQLYKGIAVTKPISKLGSATIKNIVPGAVPSFVGLVGDSLYILPNSSRDSLAYIYNIAKPSAISHTENGVIRIPESIFMGQGAGVLQRCIQNGNMFYGKNYCYSLENGSFKQTDSLASMFIDTTPIKPVGYISNYISDGIQADSLVTTEFLHEKVGGGTIYIGHVNTSLSKTPWSKKICHATFANRRTETYIYNLPKSVVYRQRNYIYGPHLFTFIDTQDTSVERKKATIPYNSDLQNKIEFSNSQIKRIAGRYIDVSSIDSSSKRILLDTTKNVMYLIYPDSVVSWSMAAPNVSISNNSLQMVKQMKIKKQSVAMFSIALPVSEIANIQVISLTGRVVYQRSAPTGSVVLNLEGIASGPYLIVARQGKNLYTMKFNKL